MASVGSLRNSCMTIGILRPSQRDMSMDVAHIGEVDAESKQNSPDGCVTLQAVTLRRPIFK
jgi:hypothetical protein